MDSGPIEDWGARQLKGTLNRGHRTGFVGAAAAGLCHKKPVKVTSLLLLRVIGGLVGMTVIGAAALQPAGRTFHVDAREGDDASDGLSPGHAWRTVARVNQAPLAPGDSVLFKRGQSWRGQLQPRSGSPQGAVRYGAFGEGPKPILLGSADASRAEDWMDEGDDRWATVPRSFAPVKEWARLDEGRWWIHQEGGAQCVLRTVAGTDAAGVALEIRCDQPGTQPHHLQLSLPGMAVAEGDYLLVLQARATHACRPASVSIMQSQPPWTAYATPAMAVPEIGSDWQEWKLPLHAAASAKDARLTLFLGGALKAGSTLFLRPGRLMTARCDRGLALPVDVGNLIFDGGRSTGVKKWGVAELQREGDYFYDASAQRVHLRSAGNPATRHQGVELALNRHIIDQSGRHDVAYEDLDLRYGAAHGIGGSDTRRISVRRCDLSFIGGGHQFTGTDGRPIRFGNGIEFWSGARDNRVEDCRLWEIYDAALTNQGDGTNVQENLVYRGNVIWSCEYSFEFWDRGPASQVRNIVFENNTCVDAGHGWGHRQRPDPNGRHLMFYDSSAATTNVAIRGNIFCNATDSCLRLHGRDWTQALQMDRNCWFQRQGAMVLWGERELGPDGFLGFMHARGFDLHSVVADPRFVDEARRDYRLASDSPARDLAGPAVRPRRSGSGAPSPASQ